MYWFLFESGFFQQYLYGSQAKHLSYNDFINKELILFSNSDNERSIPSLVDGLCSHSISELFGLLLFCGDVPLLEAIVKNTTPWRKKMSFSFKTTMIKTTTVVTLEELWCGSTFVVWLWCIPHGLCNTAGSTPAGDLCCMSYSPLPFFPLCLCCANTNKRGDVLMMGCVCFVQV